MVGPLGSVCAVRPAHCLVYIIVSNKSLVWWVHLLFDIFSIFIMPFLVVHLI